MIVSTCLVCLQEFLTAPQFDGLCSRCHWVADAEEVRAMSPEELQNLRENYLD